MVDEPELPFPPRGPLLFAPSHPLDSKGLLLLPIPPLARMLLSNDLFEIIDLDLGVDGRGGDLAMAEELLDVAEVRSSLKKVRRADVPGRTGVKTNPSAAAHPG